MPRNKLRLDEPYEQYRRKPLRMPTFLAEIARTYGDAGIVDMKTDLDGDTTFIYDDDGDESARRVLRAAAVLASTLVDASTGPFTATCNAETHKSINPAYELLNSGNFRMYSRKPPHPLMIWVNVTKIVKPYRPTIGGDARRPAFRAIIQPAHSAREQIAAGLMRDAAKRLAIEASEYEQSREHQKNLTGARKHMNAEYLLANGLKRDDDPRYLNTKMYDPKRR